MTYQTTVHKMHDFIYRSLFNHIVTIYEVNKSLRHSPFNSDVQKTSKQQKNDDTKDSVDVSFTVYRWTEREREGIGGRRQDG